MRLHAPSILAASAIGFLSFGSVAAQSAQVTVTPANGNYPVSWQLAVHVEFCITDANEHFLNAGTVTHNGNLVASGQAITPPYPCVDAQSADVNITLVDGTNTVTATVQTYTGENVDVVYTWDQTRTYTTPPPPPFVDLGPHNGYNRNAAMCALACFDKVTSYTAPAYWSLDAPRAATLFYSSGQVESRHIVEFRVSTPAAVTPNQITAKLRRPDGSYVTLTNGSTVASFTPPNVNLHRYAIQFEDSTLATGGYNFTLVVAAIWGSSVSETTAPIRVLVINERTSPYGAGWSIAGLGRVIEGPGDSVVTYDGAGTIQFWRLTGCISNTCTYAAPAGVFDQLTRSRNPLNLAEWWYNRTTADGTKLTFYNFSGNRLVSVEDVFHNVTSIKWKSTDPSRIDSIIDPVGKAIVFTYDGSNRLASIRDRPGNRPTKVTINAQNNLTQIQDTLGGKPFQQGAYDAYHRLLSLVNRRDDRWASGYDAAGKLAVDSTPSVTADTTSDTTNTAAYLPLVTRYRSPWIAGLSAIDSGGIGTVTPAVGKARKVRVDSWGALQEVLSPLSKYVFYGRNQYGQVTEALDSAGHHYLQWSGPRLTQDYDQNTGKVINMEWNTTTNRITRRYGNGTVEQRYFYDATGYRLDSTKTTTQPATRFTYDSRGRVLTMADPRGHVASMFYDGNSWFNTDSTKIGSRRTWLRYDAVAGRVNMVQRPGGRIDTTFYDLLNRITRTAGPLGDSTRYTYGDSLNLTKITDELGHATRVQKNSIGWDTLAIGAVSDTQRFEYNRLGQIKRLKNRRGQLTRFAYDSIGRLTSRILADGRITNFSVGALKTVVSNAEGSDTTRIAGDTAYEVTVRGSYSFTVRTVHDTSTKDFIVRLSPAPISPNNWLEVRYDIDSAGRTQRILPQEANPDTMTYVSDFLVTGMRLHGAASLSYQTRSGHDLARLVYTPGVLQTSFGSDLVQDTAGRVVQQVKGNGGEYENYTYDVRGRLTGFNRYTASPACAPTDTLSEFGSACTTGTTVLASGTFTYDDSGNRTDGGAAIDGSGRLVRFTGDTLFYDADGNLVRRYRLTDSLVFNQRLFWNSINQLDSVLTIRSGSLQVVRFGYDGTGRRVRKTVGASTTYYIFSGPRVAGEYTGAGAFVRAYAYQPGLDHPHAVYQSGAWHYYVTDGRGNIRGLVNSAATTVEAEYKYLPYGDTVSTSGSLANNIRFAGREYDSETGLYYNRARYYDPNTGRFVSEDAGGLLTWNRYTYSANDPVNRRDPSGRSCVSNDGGVRQASPPVGFASGASDDDDESIWCDDGGGGVGGSGAGAGANSGWFDWTALWYDPLFANGGLPYVDFTPINVAGIGTEADGISAAPDRFRYETSAMKELYLCPRGLRTIQDVAFTKVTVTYGSGPFAGIPFVGSGSGNMTLDFVRPDGDNAIYAVVANIHFDGQIGDYTGGVVGTHYSHVDCANGKVTGGGIGFLY
jgi:RHS repeat-associated protein